MCMIFTFCVSAVWEEEDNFTQEKEMKNCDLYAVQSDHSDFSPPDWNLKYSVRHT